MDRLQTFPSIYLCVSDTFTIKIDRVIKVADLPRKSASETARRRIWRSAAISSFNCGHHQSPPTSEQLLFPLPLFISCIPPRSFHLNMVLRAVGLLGISPVSI